MRLGTQRPHSELHLYSMVQYVAYYLMLWALANIVQSLLIYIG